MKTNFATRKRDAARVAASQRDEGNCYCRTPVLASIRWANSVNGCAIPRDSRTKC